MDASDKTNPKNNAKFSVRDIVGAVVGLSGLFAAIAWFFGRMHYSGYLEALGIPITETNTSTNDVISIGSISLVPFTAQLCWVFLLFFCEIVISKSIPDIVEGIERRASDRHKKFLKISFYSALIVIVAIALYFLRPFVIPINFVINPKEFPWQIILFFILGIFVYDLWVQFMQSISNSHQQLAIETGLNRVLNFTKILLFCTLIFYLFLQNMWSVYQTGYQSGCEFILNKDSMIMLYSTEELPLENLSFIRNSNNIFEYSGYSGVISDDYLLLYKDVNPTTNRPEKIYFVPKNKLLSFNLADGRVSEVDRNKNKIACGIASSQQLEKLFSTTKTP